MSIIYSPHLWRRLDNTRAAQDAAAADARRESLAEALHVAAGGTGLTWYLMEGDQKDIWRRIAGKAMEELKWHPQ